MTLSKSGKSSSWERNNRQNEMATLTYSLNLDEFRSYAKEGNLIPLYREILADHDTPVSAFAKIDHGPSAYLLESVQGGGEWARYSFLGSGSPIVMVEDRGDLCIKKGTRSRRIPSHGAPLDRLREFVAAGKIGSLAPRAYTFMGGIYSSRKVRARLAPAIRERLQQDEVDLALLVPV